MCRGISGAELREVLAQTMDKKWGNYPLMGLGFRGKDHGKNGL